MSEARERLFAETKANDGPLHQYLESLEGFDKEGVYHIISPQSDRGRQPRVTRDMLKAYSSAPRALKKALFQYFQKYPLDTIAVLAKHHPFDSAFPFRRFFKALTNEQLLSTLLVRSPSEPHRFSHLLQEIPNEVVRRMKRGQLSFQEEILVLRRLSHLSQVSGKHAKILLAHVESRIRNTKKIGNKLHYQASLTPQNFPTPKAYVEWSQRFFESLVEDLAPKLERNREQTLIRFVELMKSAQRHLDPLTRRANLLTVAQTIRATPKEMDLFHWEHGVRDEHLGEGLAYTKAFLEGFRKLTARLQWRAIEWLRGKEKKLSVLVWKRQENEAEETAFKTIRESLRQGLAKRGVIVSEEEALTTFRTIYDSLTPLGRSVFIQLALGGDDGLLKRGSIFPQAKTNREGIEKVVLTDFPKEVRKVSKELFDAAIHAFPKGFDLILLSIALAESGKGGTPEEALRMVFQHQGGLVKKFGQMLAFETRLPESYRKELQKLWDEVPAPDWGTVLRLIKFQKGNIWDSGYEIVRIANSGTTEILVEVRDPHGKSLMLSVQHEGVKAGANTDYNDMKKFLSYLYRLPNGRERYGFMRLLLKDSARTMKQELNPHYKEKVTPLMRKSYAHAGEKLGGRSSKNGLFKLKGWHFDTAKFVTRTLDDGTKVSFQEKAAGIPLKDLKRSHPRLYRQLAPTLLAIENEVQNSTRMIDKDRMPGQILVDPKSRTVTFLDFGQAKKVSVDSLKVRDNFIGVMLSNNPDRIESLLRTLGIKLSEEEMTSLKADLKAAPTGARPLAALNWLDLNNKFQGEIRQAFFWDLVHVVRAKTRLGQWGESDKVNILRNEWRSLASKNMSFKQWAGACLGFAP